MPSHYKSERSCKETIQRIIENYCPESDNYSNKRIAYFNRVGHGIYRLVPESERRYKEVKTHKVTGRKRSDAVKLMSQYYRSHKHLLLKNVSKERESIITRLMLGESVELVFESYRIGSL